MGAREVDKTCLREPPRGRRSGEGDPARGPRRSSCGATDARLSLSATPGEAKLDLMPDAQHQVATDSRGQPRGWATPTAPCPASSPPSLAATAFGLCPGATTSAGARAGLQHRRTARGRRLGAALGAPTLVLLGCILGSAVAGRADDWPQWLGPQRDSVWRETGILDRFPPGGPPVRWRVPIGGGFSGPAVAKGRVYVMDRTLSPNAAKPASPFDRGAIPGQERILCLNATDGRQLWQSSYPCAYTMSYPAGPRTTPLIHGGKVFTLGGEGNLHCLDAASGRPIWSHDLKRDYHVPTPMWGFAGHPLLAGNHLICLVGGDGTTVVAFDKDTGQERWRALSAKEPGYAPPTLIRCEGKTRVVVWDPESVNCLDPATGHLEWTVPFTSRTGLSVATPRQAGDRLFVTAFYDGSLMLRLTGGQPQVLWQSTKHSERNTDGLHSLISTPFLDDGCVYGVCSYGQLRGLDATTGRRLWETLAATTADGQETRWANAFLVKNGARYFLFNEKGDLIIAQLSPRGYTEISRAHLLEPTNPDPGRLVVWSHPAFADRCVFARNDREIICASLAQAAR